MSLDGVAYCDRDWYKALMDKYNEASDDLDNFIISVHAKGLT